MSVVIIGLLKLLDRFGDEEVSSFLSSFKCTVDRDAEEFLTKTSLKHERNGISRTYLLVKDDRIGDEEIIMGYFTLAVKCLTVDDRKNIPCEIMDQMNVDRGIAQAYLLGQLAKADMMESGFGRSMIEFAVSIFEKGHDMFGCRLIRLDCKDELVRYYSSCGFTFIGKNRDLTLNQMVAIL